MKKLFLITLFICPLIFCSAKNNSGIEHVFATVEQEQLYNTPLVPVNKQEDLTATSESESVQRATKAENTTYPTGLESPSESVKKLENTKVPTFDELYTPPNKETPKNSDGSPELFKRNTSSAPSWEGEKIDIDKYYDKQKDGSYIRKGSKRTDSQTITFIIVFALITTAIGLVYKYNTTNKK